MSMINISWRRGFGPRMVVPALSILALLGPCLLLAVNTALWAYPCPCEGTPLHASTVEPWWYWTNLLRAGVQALCALALAHAGAATIRGRRASLALPCVAALLPVGFALWRAHDLSGQMAEAIAQPTVWLGSLDVRVSDAFAHQLDAAQVGAFCSGAAMLAVAIAAGALMPNATRAPGMTVMGAAERGLRRMTLALGSLAVLGCGLARAGSGARVVWLDGLSISLAVGAVPLAIVAGRRLLALDTGPDGTDAREALSALVLCAFAFGAAAVLLHAPVLAFELRTPDDPAAPWGCSAWGVGLRFPRPLVLVELAARGRLLAAYGLACIVPFVPPLVAGAATSGWARGSRSGLAIAAGVGLVGLLGVQVGSRIYRDVVTYRASYDRWEQVLARGDVTLPVSRGGTFGVASLPRWMVTRSGLVDPWLGETPRGEVRPWNGWPWAQMDLAADGAVPVDRMIRDLAAVSPPGGLAVRLMASPQIEPRRYSDLFRIPLAAYELSIGTSLADLAPKRSASGDDDPGPEEIGVLPDAGTVQLFAFRLVGARVAVVGMGPSLPLAPRTSAWGYDELRDIHGPRRFWNRGKTIVIAPRAGTTIDELCAVLDVLGPWLSAIVVTVDRAPLEAGVAEWGAWARNNDNEGSHP